MIENCEFVPDPRVNTSFLCGTDNSAVPGFPNASMSFRVTVSGDTNLSVVFSFDYLNAGGVPNPNEVRMRRVVPHSNLYDLVQEPPRLLRLVGVAGTPPDSGGEFCSLMLISSNRRNLIAELRMSDIAGKDRHEHLHPISNHVLDLHHILHVAGTVR